MSEIDYSAPLFMEVWDPQLRRNVYLNNGMTPGEYIQQNAAHYQGYTGAVQHVGNTPIHASTFTGAPEPKAPAEYRRSYERTRANPYDTQAQQEWDTNVKRVAEEARVLPGARPDIGWTPELGGVNLMNFTPIDWADVPAQREPDEVERQLLRLAQERNLPFPTLKSLTWDKGQNPAEAFSQRGFRYGGEPTPEEAQLTQDFLTGKPTNINRLAQLRQGRVERVPQSSIQRFANKYWGPAVVAGVGTIAGFGGPLVGAGVGAIGAGSMTRWENPGAILAGAAGGYLGGYGGAQLGQYLGAGPIVGGALTGSGAALGGTAAQQIATGEFDPGNLVRNTAIGAGAGAASGATAQTNAQGQPIPNTAIPSPAFSGPANVIADQFDPRRRRNPYR